MVSYKSGNQVVLISKETTWGTYVTATKDVGIVQSAPFNLSKVLTKQFGAGSSEMQTLILGKFEHSGSIEADFQHGRLLELLFGTVAHDATDTPDIKHTFTFNETLPSFSLENGMNASTDTVHKFEGCMVVAGKITVPGLDEAVKVSVDWIAEDVNTDTTSSSAVISTLETLHGSQADFKIGGSSVDEVQDCEFTINRNTASAYGLNSQKPQDMASKEFSIDFKATIGFKNKDEADRLLAATGFDVELDTDNGISAGSGKRQLYLKLENCQYGTHDVAGTLGDFYYVTVSGSGDFHSCHSYCNIVEGSW